MPQQYLFVLVCHFTHVVEEIRECRELAGVSRRCLYLTAPPTTCKAPADGQNSLCPFTGLACHTGRQMLVCSFFLSPQPAKRTYTRWEEKRWDGAGVKQEDIDMGAAACWHALQRFISDHIVGMAVCYFYASLQYTVYILSFFENLFKGTSGSGYKKNPSYFWLNTCILQQYSRSDLKKM